MKLWDGRFTKTTNSFVDHFHSSISFDKRLYKHDIMGSIAHVDMLAKQGVIAQEDGVLIRQTLLDILKDIESGTVTFDESAEDIHMNIETILIQRIGDAGKKIHTGRSRNDQVALDMKMYIRDEIDTIKIYVKELLATINGIAKKNASVYMPGYTHLQKAQPVTFAHHILAYFEMFKRDWDRLTDCRRRMNTMPLGAGALAGTTYPLDRDYVCKALHFHAITLNSMDSVSDRDFCIELSGVLSIIMMHLSRFCEELVLWSSNEFHFITLDETYSTGSSIMPQKKNPDMAELIRGKTGRVYGSLITLLTVMKGLPLSYNKDMQEDKEAIFDAIDTVKMCLPVFTGMISTMTVQADDMLVAAHGGFMNATDVADWLVKRGTPFRDAHKIVGKLTLYAITQNKKLEELTLEEFNAAAPLFDETIFDAITVQACVENRNLPGGPAKAFIDAIIKENDNFLKQAIEDNAL